MHHNVTRRAVLATASVAAAGSLVSLGVASAEETAVAQQLVSADVLDFLYIDNAEMYVGEEQSVVVSLNDVTETAASALVLVNEDTGAEISIEMSGSSEGALLFTFTPSEAGIYSVASLTYSDDAGTHAVDFTDADSSYRSFVASYAVSAMSLSDEPGDNELSLQVYSSDGADDVAVSDSIEEGAALADSMSASARSLSTSRKAGNIVVALDPGHVGVSSGAVGVNGAREADLTWKIAQYCKAELDSYWGVTTVYTITPGSSFSGEELQARVNSAVSQDADVLVSLHLNSTGNGNAYGAEIYVPYSADYNSSTHAVGEALAQKIIGRLEALGLYNRGVKVRTIGSHDSDYDYPNGAIGDYYGIIRHARERNLPAIIVEHAFIDNRNDYTGFLNSESKLKSLGVADATGIANYFGLSKDSSSEKKMYRLYNPNSGEHFYTADSYERDQLVSVGWRYEGVGWSAPSASNTPVYRLYNPNAGDHHYTTSSYERDQLVSVGWRYEGIGWYSDDAKAVAVYRQYNPNAIAGAHNFTTDSYEQDYLVSVGWRAEGIGWYATNA